LPPPSCALPHGALLDMLDRIGHMYHAATRKCLECESGRARSRPPRTRCSTSAIVSLRSGGHHRIEVSRGLAVDEIALGIALPGVHDRHISHQAPLHNITARRRSSRTSLPSAMMVPTPVLVKKAGMPAPPARMRSASVPCGVNSSSSSPERNCWAKEFVLADIGRDHFPDLARFEQRAEPNAIDAGIVGNDGQIAWHPRGFAPRRSMPLECRRARSRPTL
jgi:hypothetical protein